MDGGVWHRAILAADRVAWDGLARQFRERDFDARQALVGLGILLLAAVAVWFLSRLVNVLERRAGYDGPKRLFVELCRAHALSWSEAWLLWRTARAQRLADPSRVFVEPERLAPVNLPRGLRMHAERLDRIAGRLFARQSGSGEKPSLVEPPPGPHPLLPTPTPPALEIPGEDDSLDSR